MAIEGPETQTVTYQEEAARRARVADEFAAWNAAHPDGCLPLDAIEASVGVVGSVVESAAERVVSLPVHAARVGGLAVRSLGEVFSPIAAR
jgi:hypothetical protein